MSHQQTLWREPRRYPEELGPRRNVHVPFAAALPEIIGRPRQGRRAWHPGTGLASWIIAELELGERAARK